MCIKFIKLMAKIWDLPLASNEKLILLKLADHANEKGYCWPSIKNISDKCSIHKTTVHTILNKLEQLGYISRFRRNRDNGSKMSNLYKINLEPDEKSYPSSETLLASRVGFDEGVVANGYHGSSPTLSLEPTIETNTTTTTMVDRILNSYKNVGNNAIEQNLELAKKFIDVYLDLNFEEKQLRNLKMGPGINNFIKNNITPDFVKKIISEKIELSNQQHHPAYYFQAIYDAHNVFNNLSKKGGITYVNFKQRNKFKSFNEQTLDRVTAALTAAIERETKKQNEI
jgi:predicted transcriptional regulator